MTRLQAALMGALLIAVTAFAGCGGGGGGSTASTGTGEPLEPTTGRILTGTVVSSLDGEGVDNVVVRLVGTGYAGTTKGGGKFSIDLGSADATLLYFFSVDTTGAGSTFPSSELVRYNQGETYYADEVDIPLAILNGASNDFGTITVGEVTDPSQPPPPPIPVHDTVIMGRVASTVTGLGIANVAVLFGYTPAVTATTGAKGYFALNLGDDASVLPLFPADSWPPTFSIDTSNAAGFSTALQVTFNLQTGPQSSIVVPTDVLTGATRILGTIQVRDDGGGDNPPPPPTTP